MSRGDLLRKREEFTVSLRKKTKEEKLSRLRYKHDTKSRPSNGGIGIHGVGLASIHSNDGGSSQDSAVDPFIPHPAFNDLSKSPVSLKRVQT